MRPHSLGFGCSSGRSKRLPSAYGPSPQIFPRRWTGCWRVSTRSRNSCGPCARSTSARRLTSWRPRPLGDGVIGRRDGLEAGELRDLAIAVRDHPGVEAVGVVGVTGPERVALVVAATKASGIDARAAVGKAAAALGGGGGGTPELATAGGRNVAGVEEALVRLQRGAESEWQLELVTTGPAARGGHAVVGIDLGERRIGVSVSDTKRFSRPHIRSSPGPVTPRQTGGPSRPSSRRWEPASLWSGFL